MSAIDDGGRLSQAADGAISELIRWAEVREPVRAMLLTSTRVTPGAPVDALSDYDVILVVREIQPYVSDRAWLSDFGEVLVAYWDPVYPDPVFGVERCGNVTQYTSGLKIDFNLWPVALLERVAAAPALPAELDAGYRVLLDKDSLTASLLPPTGRAYIPAPPTPEEFRLLVTDFLSDAPYVAKCLRRNELLPARWCLDCDMKHLYLRRALEWRAQIDCGWSAPAGHFGKGLKRRLPAELWAQVEETFTGAGLEDTWIALERALVLFRRVALEVGARLGYAYPEELHRRVCAYVEKIRYADLEAPV